MAPFESCSEGGVQKGAAPFAASLRVSLKYRFFSFLTRKGTKAMVDRAFRPGF